MQSQIEFNPVYEIGYVIKKLQDKSIKRDQLAMSAKNFRMLARCILKVLPDSLNHDLETMADKAEQSFVVEAANGFLEAADYLEELSEKTEN